MIPSNAETWQPTLLTGEPPDPTAIPAGCRFHPRCSRWAQASEEARAVAGCDRRELPVLAAAAAGSGSGPAAACHLLDPIRSLENA